MKRILFFILLFAWAGSKTTVNAEVPDTNKEIPLTAVQDDTEREIKGKQSETTSGDVPVSRSIVLQPVYAYLYNKVVSLDFTETFSAVNVVITNQATGETIHSETYSNPATLCIDLNGESGGNYFIEIEADDTLLTGNFSL